MARERTERENLRSTGRTPDPRTSVPSDDVAPRLPVTAPMAGYTDNRVPRGTSRRWEVLMSSEESERRQTRPQLRAQDVVSQHRVLREVPESLLTGIPLLDEGTPLERRHDYLDLHDPARADFRAEGTEIVKPGQHLVARDAVSDEAWSELRAACDRIARRRPLRPAA